MEVAHDKKLHADLKLLAKFIGVYCRHRHAKMPEAPVLLSTHDISAFHAKPLELCADCRRLLAHAFVKRTACPLDPKPTCKRCPEHCYAPHYRQQIREVMKYSGRRLVLTGRLDYLIHLLF